MTINIDCFKAYDVRGRIPDQLNTEIAYRVGNATAEFLQAGRMVLCRDIRHSSEALAAAVADGLADAGVEVLDVGVGGTEMVYFATSHLATDGGIMVTASHNPADYNGLKLVREESRPLSGDTGLKDIRRIAEGDTRTVAAQKGIRTSVDISAQYLQKLLSFVDLGNLHGLKIVVNAGNGAAGPTIDLLEPSLPFEFIRIHHEANGDFPNGVPNPMLQENRASTVEAITGHRADLGVAWDGDFDRCFFFDENGRFIEGYYIVGLLAESLLVNNPEAAIIFDPRLTWNTLEVVQASNGRAVQSKSGHSFIKQVMREQDAIYGGEMSAHHYFRDFYYCDSGMIPWLLVAELMCKTGRTLSELVDDRMRKFPASGEINRQVANPDAAIRQISERYQPGASAVDKTDGISIEFADWRFNLRSSNTEPVIRLNVESRGNESLLQDKVGELLELLDQLA